MRWSAVAGSSFNTLACTCESEGGIVAGTDGGPAAYGCVSRPCGPSRPGIIHVGARDRHRDVAGSTIHIDQRDGDRAVGRWRVIELGNGIGPLKSDPKAVRIPVDDLVFVDQSVIALRQLDVGRG